MAKMSFHFTVATSSKVVIDTAAGHAAIDKLLSMDLTEHSPTDKAFVGVVKQAFEKDGYESAIREMVRWGIRVGINEKLLEVTHESNAGLAITFAPSAVRFAEVK